MPNNRKRQRDDGGSMLATIIVVMLGAVVCVFIGAVSGSVVSDWLWGLVAAVPAMVLGWIIWYRYLRGASHGLGFWYSVSRNHREDGLAAQYRPRKVRDRRSETSGGTNEPITAEEARDIQDTSANTWVPSKNREGGQA